MNQGAGSPGARLTKVGIDQRLVILPRQNRGAPERGPAIELLLLGFSRYRVPKQTLSHLISGVP